MEHNEVFILLKDKQGEKPTIMGALFGNTPCNVLRGELAIRIPEKRRKSGQQPHNYQTVYSELTATFHDSIKNSDFAPLLGNQALLLAGVPSKEERYKMFITPGKLEWGSSLKVNNPVLVSFKDSQTEATRKATVVIRYVGPVKREKGIVFGVEIVEPHFFGEGKTDGTFQGEHYFTSAGGNGMFVSFDRLSEIPPGFQAPVPNDQSAAHEGSKKGSGSQEKQSRFQLNDRVVAFRGDGTSVGGTVRWVGPYSLVTNKKQQFSVAAVGIETDIKILGTDMESCLPAKHQYFQVGKKNSHLFMREEDIMLEEDFIGEQQREPDPSRKPRHPRNSQPSLQQPLQEKPKVPPREPLNPEDPTKLAEQMGVGHTKFMNEQSDILERAANMGVGSPVELVQDPTHHGVVMWLGTLPEARGLVAGVELDAPIEGCEDGEWNGRRFFTCPPGRAFFCPVSSLRPDPRIQHVQSNPQQIALQVERYKKSKGQPIESAVREADLLISDLQETGRTLGTGSYGEVIEVRVRGRRCAAKKLHGIFNARDVPLKEKSAAAERFETECRRVLYLSHPSIIEMIGIHFDRATHLPTLVMELMDTSLCKYLENNPKSSVLLSTKYSILHDVAGGLVYLHSLPPPLGPIVHRDLTANNILLALASGVVAKIADLGQAKIDSEYATRQHQYSQVPGNGDHMPPEAWLDNPVYNASLDVFSFGVVMLHTLSHEWPKPLGRLKSAMEVCPEVERRKPYLDKISDNPLKPVVKQCLSQLAEDRPLTNDVHDKLKVCIGQLVCSNLLRASSLPCSSDITALIHRLAGSGPIQGDLGRHVKSGSNLAGLESGPIQREQGRNLDKPQPAPRRSWSPSPPGSREHSPMVSPNTAPRNRSTHEQWTPTGPSRPFPPPVEATQKPATLPRQAKSVEVEPRTNREVPRYLSGSNLVRDKPTDKPFHFKPAAGKHDEQETPVVGYIPWHLKKLLAATAGKQQLATQGSEVHSQPRAPGRQQQTTQGSEVHSQPRAPGRQQQTTQGSEVHSQPPVDQPHTHPQNNCGEYLVEKQQLKEQLQQEQEQRMETKRKLQREKQEKEEAQKKLRDLQLQLEQHQQKKLRKIMPSQQKAVAVISPTNVEGKASLSKPDESRLDKRGDGAEALRQQFAGEGKPIERANADASTLPRPKRPPAKNKPAELSETSFTEPPVKEPTAESNTGTQRAPDIATHIDLDDYWVCDYCTNPQTPSTTVMYVKDETLVTHGSASTARTTTTVHLAGARLATPQE